MRPRENKDIAPGQSGLHCAALACVSTGRTSPAAGNKNLLSWSQLDTPQPFMWLLRSTQQIEVDVRDSPAGYLLTPPPAQGDLKSLMLKVVEPPFTIGLDPCRSVWNSHMPSAMFCPLHNPLQCLAISYGSCHSPELSVTAARADMFTQHLNPPL